MSFINAIFLSNREGKIAFFSSLFYLAAGIVIKTIPSLRSNSGLFFADFGFLGAFVLLILFVRMGCYRQSYRSNAFDTILLVIVALIPAFFALAVSFKR